MKYLAIYAIGLVVLFGLVWGGLYAARFFGAATLHTQVITPKPGVECVVVSASDSTSVDCWESI